MSIVFRLIVSVSCALHIATSFSYCTGEKHEFIVPNKNHSMENIAVHHQHNEFLRICIFLFLYNSCFPTNSLSKFEILYDISHITGKHAGAQISSEEVTMNERGEVTKHGG